MWVKRETDSGIHDSARRITKTVALARIHRTRVIRQRNGDAGASGRDCLVAFELDGRWVGARSRHLGCCRRSAITAGDGMAVWDAAEDTRGLVWRELAGTRGCPVSGSGASGAVRPGVGWRAIVPRRH